RPALIQELCPIVVQLVVHDPLGVIDAPVQSHVETEGEEAHGVGFYEKRAQRAAARAIDAMPHPRWVSARRNSTPPNPSPGSAAHCAQKTDPIAGDTPPDSSNGYVVLSTRPFDWRCVVVVDDDGLPALEQTETQTAR